MLKIFIATFFAHLLILIFCNPILAVSIDSKSDIVSMTTTEGYSINVNINGANDATNYLRVDLFKEGTNNYFGETYNGKGYYGGSDGKSYFPIEIINSSASANLNFRLGQPTPTEYLGPGEYKLKVRRYTSSGNVASNDSQSPIGIRIDYIFYTPSPVPVPTTVVTSPAKTVSPSPVTLLVKSQPPVTALPISLEIKKTNLPIVIQPTQSPELKILGIEQNILSDQKNFTNETQTDDENQASVLPFILIFVGIMLIGVGVIVVLHQNHKYGVKNDI